MELLGVLLLTVATLAAAAYTQYRLPYHSATKRQLWFNRLLLLVLGVLFGWVISRQYAMAGEEGIILLLIFLSAFGLVHVPSAFILYIKRRRHVWR